MSEAMARRDVELGGAPEGLDALVVAERLKAQGGVGLLVARDYQRSGNFTQALSFFAKDVEVLEYPAWDCLPYDRLSPTASVAAQRMATLTRLAQRDPSDAGPLLVVATIAAVTQRTPPRQAVTGAGFEARVGRDLDTAALERYVSANGYVRASTVSERGEYAIRGGVIDVFPPGFEEPVRLDLFGSELESIRAFDPETQRSTKQLKQVSLLPVSEVLLDAQSISRFRSGYLNLFGAAETEVKSVALIRMAPQFPGAEVPARHAICAFGSPEEDGFTPTMGCELVAFIARVVERTAERWPIL